MTLLKKGMKNISDLSYQNLIYSVLQHITSWLVTGYVLKTFLQVVVSLLNICSFCYSKMKHYSLPSFGVYLFFFISFFNKKEPLI